MFKGNFAAVTTTANTNIPIDVVWNTNDNTRYNSTDNAVEILASGYYNVNVMLNITGSTPTTIGAQLFADGTAIAESLTESDITATTGTKTLNITDTIKVNTTTTSGYAEISLRLDNVATITNGVITIEKVR